MGSYGNKIFNSMFQGLKNPNTKQKQLKQKIKFLVVVMTSQYALLFKIVGKTRNFDFQR